MLTDLQIARVAHEANRAYCLTQQDDSLTPWDTAPDWQVDAVVDGVAFVRANPDATPSTSHTNWWKVKREAGWVYGAVKDVDAKTHPCCVPYDDLSATQRRRDVLFLAVVRALLREEV